MCRGEERPDALFRFQVVYLGLLDRWLFIFRKLDMKVIQELDETALVFVVSQTPAFYPRIVLFQRCAICSFLTVLFFLQHSSLHFLRMPSVCSSSQPERAMPSSSSYSGRKRTIPPALLQPQGAQAIRTDRSSRGCARGKAKMRGAASRSIS